MWCLSACDLMGYVMFFFFGKIWVQPHCIKEKGMEIGEGRWMLTSDFKLHRHRVYIPVQSIDNSWRNLHWIH